MERPLRLTDTKSCGTAARGCRVRKAAHLRGVLQFARVALVVVVCLGSHAALAAPRFVDPWPDEADARGVRTETVTLASSDPFIPEDIGHAPQRAVTARLFLPAEASPRHPVPAVVLLHGSAGNVAERGERYGVPLAAMGVAVMVVDSYASRPDLGDSYIARVLHITETMFVADAYAALRALAARPDIDASHVALVGFSYGGMAATYALYAQMADRLAPPGLRFIAHAAYYAPCIARFADSRTTGAPLLMLYGQDDELMRADRCEQIAQDLRSGGSDVRIISYPGAVHQWDGEMQRRTIGGHLADCRFEVNRDGSVTDRNTLLPMTGPFTRKLILGLCTGSRPYPIGRDEAVRARSDHDFAAFLERAFSRRSPPAG